MGDTSSESDSEYCDTQDYFSNNLNKMVREVIDMQAENSQNLSTIRSKLLSSQLPSSGESVNLRNTASRRDRDKIDDSFKSLSDDIKNFQTKLNSIYDCVLSVLDSVESLQNRVKALEDNSSSQTTTSNTYSAAILGDAEKSRQRLDRLEFLSSEDERKKRTLQVSVTHPSIDQNASDLENRLECFFQDVMKMPLREMDANTKVQKTGRANTVLVTFSAKRFKIFLFKARRRLRDENENLTENLYLNDNLTPYNFSILMSLKREKSRRSLENLPNFAAVYAIDGKVYVKMTRESSNQESIYVKSQSTVKEILQKIDNHE